MLLSAEHDPANGMSLHVCAYKEEYSDLRSFARSQWIVTSSWAKEIVLPTSISSCRKAGFEGASNSSLYRTVSGATSSSYPLIPSGLEAIVSAT